jgi:hypothetical protein
MFNELSNIVSLKKELIESIRTTIDKNYPDYEIKKYDFIKNAFQLNNCQQLELDSTTIKDFNNNKLIIIDDPETYLNKNILEILKKCSFLAENNTSVKGNINHHTSFQESQNLFEPSVNTNVNNNYKGINYSGIIESANISAQYFPNDRRADCKSDDKKYKVVFDFRASDKDVSIKIFIDEFNNVIYYKINTKLKISFEYSDHLKYDNILEILRDEFQNLPPPLHVYWTLFLNYFKVKKMKGIKHERTIKAPAYN